MTGSLVPDLTQRLTEAPPKFNLRPILADAQFQVNGYTVQSVSVPHPVPALGYIVGLGAGGTVGYTGDTGGGLLPFLTVEGQYAPDVLFVDVTFPSEMEDLAKLTGHLTPRLLRQRIQDVQNRGLRLPRIVAVHMSAPDREAVRSEVAQLAVELKIELMPGEEDMVIDI